MHRLIFAIALLFTPAAIADEALTIQSDAVAVPDPLAEPRELVEKASNTAANLEKAIKLYDERLADEKLAAKARADGYADLSRAWMRLADLRKGNDQKLACYERGRAAAKKALAIDPRHADALFHDAANLATTGRTRGITNSLFMLPELRKSLGRVLELDPNHHYARQTLADIDHAVPGILGGSNERAEKGYLEILRRDPSFTPAMVKLAEFYRNTGKKDEARKYANMVLQAQRSSVPNDWRKFNKHEAKALLAELGE